METIYLICYEWNWFEEKQLNHEVMYAVKDEITARNDCKRFQVQYNENGDNCYKNKRYYYKKIDIYTF